MEKINVVVVNCLGRGCTKKVELHENCTVADLLEQVGAENELVRIRVNRVPSLRSKQLHDSDIVTITPRNIEGAGNYTEEAIYELCQFVKSVQSVQDVQEGIGPEVVEQALRAIEEERVVKTHPDRLEIDLGIVETDKNIKMGPYTICVLYGSEEPLRVYSRDIVERKNPHPHISDIGVPCYKDIQEKAVLLVSTLQLEALIDLILDSLQLIDLFNMYTDRVELYTSAWATLLERGYSEEKIKGAEVTICELCYSISDPAGSLEAVDFLQCESCGANMCPSCVGDTCTCNSVYCNECATSLENSWKLSVCMDCSATVCRYCLYVCDICGGHICPDCKKECDNCSKTVCENCAPEPLKGLCKECQRGAEDDS